MAKDRTGNILVIDDEEGMRFTLNYYLAQAGYRVSQAADMAEAKTILSVNRFDVAIIDRILSNGENGINLLKIIREVQPSCRTILVSAWPTFASAVQAMQYNVFGYLTKPIKRNELLAMVSEAVGDNCVSKEPATP